MRRLAMLAVVVGLMVPSISQASFHLVKVREVFAGSLGSPTAQYIELQMYQSGQNLVAGHTVTAYDASGTLVGTFSFSGDVASGDSQDYILLATTTAQTLFSITADLVITPVLTAAGGKVCYEDIDCVSWGNFTGDANSPSASGTPFGFPDGIQSGHAIRRDISHGNASALQDGDDSDDSRADFDCVNSAAPTNNAGVSGTPYMDATPCSVCGNATKEFGEQCDGADATACPGGCQTDCACPAHDSVVSPVKPLKVKIPADAPVSVTKNIKVKVINGDVTQQGTDSIQLSASSDCPPGVAIGTPNFGGGDTVSLAGGDRATASVSLVISDTAFTTFNAKAPKRCTITFTSATVGTNPPGMGGEVPVVSNLDPQPSNNSVTVELNVFDANDPEGNTAHETYAVSLKLLKVKIGAGKTTVTKKVKPTVGNADYLPAPDMGDSIAVTVDVSDCPGPPVATLDMDSDMVGNQASSLVDGKHTDKGLLLLTFDASAVSTRNAKSPRRCTAIVTATGPSDPDQDTTNNVTKLLIDILDRNDLP